MGEEAEAAEAAPRRKVVRRELAKQRKVQVSVDGVVIDQWSEPRLRTTGEDETEAPFDGNLGERKTFEDLLHEEGRHKVTGAELLHTGATCGTCVHFRVKGRDQKLYEPEERTDGLKRLGINVCVWGIQATRGHPRQTKPGEPACVKHEVR